MPNEMDEFIKTSIKLGIENGLNTCKFRCKKCACETCDYLDLEWGAWDCSTCCKCPAARGDEDLIDWWS